MHPHFRPEHSWTNVPTLYCSGNLWQNPNTTFFRTFSSDIQNETALVYLYPQK